jgi:hypothetical protein
VLPVGGGAALANRVAVFFKADGGRAEGLLKMRNCDLNNLSYN